LRAATNPVLQVAILQSQIHDLSNRLQQATFVSSDPFDVRLQAQGYAPFARLEEPAWQNGSTVQAPAARVDHSGVWTGDRFLIWGGSLGWFPTSSGGEYDAGND